MSPPRRVETSVAVLSRRGASPRSGIRTIRGFPDPDAARAPETGAKSEFRIRERVRAPRAR
jgi:hypothetical protein